MKILLMNHVSLKEMRLFNNKNYIVIMNLFINEMIDFYISH